MENLYKTLCLLLLFVKKINFKIFTGKLLEFFYFFINNCKIKFLSAIKQTLLQCKTYSACYQIANESGYIVFQNTAKIPLCHMCRSLPFQDTERVKELSLCHKLKVCNPYIFATRLCKLLMLQT